MTVTQGTETATSVSEDEAVDDDAVAADTGLVSDRVAGRLAMGLTLAPFVVGVLALVFAVGNQYHPWSDHALIEMQTRSVGRDEVLVGLFSRDTWNHPGPAQFYVLAPFYWLTLPEEGCDFIRFEASRASYGWGAIPVRVRIGATEWETSLLPKDGGYVLPVKQLVRRAEDIEEGDTVAVGLDVAPRGGRPANGT